MEREPPTAMRASGSVGVQGTDGFAAGYNASVRSFDLEPAGITFYRLLFFASFSRKCWQSPRAR
jgi:hypothetical protein